MLSYMVQIHVLIPLGDLYSINMLTIIGFHGPVFASVMSRYQFYITIVSTKSSLVSLY